MNNKIKKQLMKPIIFIAMCALYSEKQKIEFKKLVSIYYIFVKEFLKEDINKDNLDTLKEKFYWKCMLLVGLSILKPSENDFDMENIEYFVLNKKFKNDLNKSFKNIIKNSLYKEIEFDNFFKKIQQLNKNTLNLYIYIN